MFDTDPIIISNSTRSILLQYEGEYGTIAVDVPKTDTPNTDNKYYIITGVKKLSTKVKGKCMNILQVTMNDGGTKMDKFAAYSAQKIYGKVYTLRTPWMRGLEELLDLLKKNAITTGVKESITIPFINPWGDEKTMNLTKEDILEDPDMVKKSLEEKLFGEIPFITIDGTLVYGIVGR